MFGDGAGEWVAPNKEPVHRAARPAPGGLALLATISFHKSSLSTILCFTIFYVAGQLSFVAIMLNIWPQGVGYQSTPTCIFIVNLRTQHAEFPIWAFRSLLFSLLTKTREAPLHFPGGTFLLLSHHFPKTLSFLPGFLIKLLLLDSNALFFHVSFGFFVHFSSISHLLVQISLPPCY